jgi:cytochrome c oxidase subunit 2
MASRVSALAKPRGVWWERLGPDERLWVWLAVIWGVAMFVMIAFVWPLVGQEQNRLSSYRVDPAAFAAEAEAFIARYQVGQLDGVPVVAPPPGGDIYLDARAFAWQPVIQLQRGQTYRFLISSCDVQHGFSLVMPPHSINVQVLPGYVTVLTLTPEKAGEFPLICNEYCGLGHHLMIGRIVVKE